MCGRFVSSSSPDALVAFFGIDAVDESVGHATANYNVSPTSEVLAVVERDQTRLLRTIRWGLVPSWADDPRIGSRMINARAETVATKPSFRSAFARRRCIIPADGFYEWIDDPGDRRRQPFYIHRSDGEPMAFAGLWETWRPKGTAPTVEHQPRLIDLDDHGGDAELRTCTIITTAARGPISRLHDRMPAMLDADQWESWLSPENDDKDLLKAIISEGSSAAVTFHPVAKDVNSTRSRGYQLADRMEMSESWVPVP